MPLLIDWCVCLGNGVRLLLLGIHVCNILLVLASALDLRVGSCNEAKLIKLCI